MLVGFIITADLYLCRSVSLTVCSLGRRYSILQTYRYPGILVSWMSLRLFNEINIWRH